MERTVNCLNTKVVIEYVTRHYPELMVDILDNLDPFLDKIENTKEFLYDEYNWVSQHVCAKLFERIRQYSGHKEIARNIGRESILCRRYGYFENILIKAIGTPYKSILRAPSINAKLNKTKTIEIVSASKTHAVILLKWIAGIGSTKDVCLYNQGIYEAIPSLWGLPLAQIEETKCFFQGDEYCEYVFNWKIKTFRSTIYNMFSQHQEVLKDSLSELERERDHLAKKYIEVENLNRELAGKIERLTSLNSCSQATTSILESDQLLDVVMSLIVNVMNFDRAVLMLINNDRTSLIPVKGIGQEQDDFSAISGYEIPLDHTSNILAQVVDSGIARVVPDVGKSALRRENIILKSFNPKSFVAVPLITRNRVIGVIAAERFKGMKDFSSGDLKYMMSFCNQIAISLENTKLVESMKKSFISSILSLATALEEKDAYTRGHSNRVAVFSTLVANKIGLDDERVELLRMMALMHDIGKIGIPDMIINKPGRLTDDEYGKIREHPTHGERIIEPLLKNNPQLRLLRNHHERYDGRGYPDGLKGSSIPLEVRIMSIADCFDAMTSNRSYRKAMSREEALKEIENGKGTQFCPEVADVFIEVLSSLPEDIDDMIVDSIHDTFVFND